MNIKRGVVSALGVLLVSTSIAHGQPEHPVEAPRWTFTPIIGSDVGLDLAAGLQIETPFRLRVTGTVGWMPRGYAWVLKKWLEGVYDVSDPVGNVVEDLISGALVLRANVGYRILPDRGLFAFVGYTYQRASKNGLIASALEDATDRELPGGMAPMRLFDTTASANLIDVQVGWQWPIRYGFSIQASVGLIVIASTSTTLEPTFVPSPGIEEFIRVAEDILEDAGQGKVAPIGTVFLGYTF
ncbi:MAG: hypothetical protein SFX73_40835 [Kofleriaceae bacterium]|nr:hypothetical protein [Kofleriaceae bacterium]